MAEYVKTIVAAVLAVGLLSVLVPKGSFEKYANILAGIVVMTIIVVPMLNFGKLQIDFKDIDTKKLEYDTESYMAEELGKEVENNIKDELLKRTGKNFSVDVWCENLYGAIEIKQISIAPYTDEYAEIVADFTDIDKGKVVEQ